MSNGKMIAGFALGALAGAALTCFAHSGRGHKMRKDLHQIIQDLKAKGRCCKACECGEECECEPECECNETCERKEEALK